MRIAFRLFCGFSDFSQIPEGQLQDNFYQENASYSTAQTHEDDY
jgi:hypothetical protein